MTEALVSGSGVLCPPEAKTLLALGCSIKTANMPAFNIWRQKKITDICSLHDLKSFSVTFQK